jgi:hypothetical protein
MRPLSNIQGGHELLNLTTGRIITRRKVTTIPMTPTVIATVEAMAAADGMKGLKMTTKTGHTLFDSTWTEGVHESDVDDESESDRDDESDDEDVEVDDDQDPNNLLQETIQAESPNNDDDSVEEVVEEENHDVEEEDDEVEEGGEEEEQDEVDEENHPHTQDQHQQEPRRSTRAAKPTSKYVSYKEGNFSQVQMEEYDLTEAKVIAMIICQFNERMEASTIHHGNQHLVTYSLKKGIQQFGERGRQSALKEMKQLHERRCFQPVQKESLTSTERKRALESLIFLTEKKDGSIKARHCANGSTQRDYISREDVSSPTVSTESTLLTSAIEAAEAREVATCDIPNAFIQTQVDKKDEDGNRTIMKIRGVLVDILCEMDPGYIEYVVMEGNQKVLYVHVLMAIYGLLVSAILFYKKLVGDLTKYGFKINPYDPCVANKMVQEKQMTVSWHVDDLKISHEETKIVDSFLEWIKKTYGSIGEVKTTRGKIHDYLGMKLDYTVKGQVSIDMVGYIESMVSNFPKDYMKGPTVASPWNENLFKVDESSPTLSKEMAELFHTITAQGLFACKRGRPDISPAVAYLTTRVHKPNHDDWLKLTRMMKYLRQTKDDCLTLRVDGSKKIKWYVDASFAVHPDFRSHTGAVMTMGSGAITSISRKQSLNSRSSTEAEVIAADDAVGPALWTKLFLDAQGYGVKENILFQDNKSAMLLEKNGRKSAGKRSRHLNIRFFFIKDQQEKGHIKISYCPTEEMVGDFMTKPLHGSKFQYFRQKIMNLPMPAQLMMLCCAQTNGQVN